MAAAPPVHPKSRQGPFYTRQAGTMGPWWGVTWLQRAVSLKSKCMERSGNNNKVAGCYSEGSGNNNEGSGPYSEGSGC